MGEGNGVVSFDRSGHGRHGAITGCTLGQPGMGDGRTSYGFDGVQDYVNWYSAALAAAFNGAEGTLMAWAKVANAGVWTDGLVHMMAYLYADGDNFIQIYKENPNLTTFTYKAGGILEYEQAANTSTEWFPATITWSSLEDEVKYYLNGVKQGNTDTALGTWVGALGGNTTNIGCSLQNPLLVWFGNIQHVALGNRALTPTEVAELSKL